MLILKNLKTYTPTLLDISPLLINYQITPKPYKLLPFDSQNNLKWQILKETEKKLNGNIKQMKSIKYNGNSKV